MDALNEKFLSCKNKTLNLTQLYMLKTIYESDS